MESGIERIFETGIFSAKSTQKFPLAIFISLQGQPVVHLTITLLPATMTSFPKIKLLAVGKIKKGWIREGLEVYQKRLPELEILEIKDSTLEKEGEQLLAQLKGRDRLIALTEIGQCYSSVEFAQFLSRAESGSLAFVIGSAAGLSEAVKRSAVQQLSLSPMTFPHELARLLLLEQLYRAKSILQGSNYHK
ncbi:MAG: 23S rRNA (pseudouridine(1915)-N(3))-methyltransferase RlmH [Cyanobacteria bacterium P01_C01_bin.120]